MQQLMTSIKREFWEESRSFVTLSTIIGGLFVLAACGGIVLMLFASHPIVWHQDLNAINADSMIGHVMHAIAIPFLIVLWLIVFNYFLSSLYDDRQDRSVFFWMSMPVSTKTTMLAKVITGLVVAPFMVSIGIALTTLALSLIALAAPIHVSMWQNLPILHPIAFFIDWFMLLVSMWMQAIWLFPLFAWCMFCSAYARKAPFLRAIVWPLIIIMIEFFTVHSGYLINFIRTRFVLAGSSWEHFMYWVNHKITTNMASSVIWQGTHYQFATLLHNVNFIQNLMVGTAVGLVFVIIAGILRYRCYGFDR